MSYQITWNEKPYGKAVKSLEKAKLLKQELLRDYKFCYEDGIIDKYEPGNIKLVYTAKK